MICKFFFIDLTVGLSESTGVTNSGRLSSYNTYHGSRTNRDVALPGKSKRDSACILPIKLLGHLLE